MIQDILYMVVQTIRNIPVIFGITMIYRKGTETMSPALC